MKTYLVGGAVRDQLLGLPIHERDWVVLDATPEQMIEAGFRPVGRDFPVFLHPDSNEEYALARTERKTAPGYHGFVFHTGPDVTLEDDLIRRDLTVNAIAQDENGSLIDPYNGRRDLDARILRHVSDAFREDPVRILRIARYASRFHHLGFKVADETLALMKAMVAAGEVDALVPERVWQETQRSLLQDRPDVFFSTLRECGALARLFPELDAQFGKPQPLKYHPEVDSGVHSLMVLEQVARMGAPLEVRYAALCHDFGKGVTPDDILPSHRGHEIRGVPLVIACNERLKVPTACADLARLVTRYHLLVHRSIEMRASSLIDLLSKLDAFRRPERFDQFLMTCEGDSRGRLGLEDRPYPQGPFLREVFTAAAAISGKTINLKGLKGEAIAQALRVARIKAVENLPRPEQAPH